MNRVCSSDIRLIYNRFYSELVKLKYAIEEEEDELKRHFIMGKINAIDDILSQLLKLT